MKPWLRRASRRVLSCGIFDLDEVTFEPPDGSPARPFYVIEAPDWINVIALTPEREVLLVRQFRFGIQGVTLEIPGGMCDVDEDPAAAAARELREETGYATELPLEDLGWVHPNPPVQTNRCHTYLARDVRRVGEQRPDEHEIIDVVLAPLDEVPGLIASGRISHALVLAAFTLYRVRASGSASGRGSGR